MAKLDHTNTSHSDEEREHFHLLRVKAELHFVRLITVYSPPLSLLLIPSVNNASSQPVRAKASVRGQDSQRSPARRSPSRSGSRRETVERAEVEAHRGDEIVLCRFCYLVRAF